MSKVVEAVVAVAAIVVGSITGQAWLVGLGISLLLSDVASLFIPKPGQLGDHSQIAYDPTYPRQVIVGRTKTSGSLVFKASHGALNVFHGAGGDNSNTWLEIVIAIADHPCDGLEQIYVDGELVGVGTEDPVLGFPIQNSVDPVTGVPGTNYAGSLYIKFFNGADGQGPDTHLNTVLGDTVWPLSSVGTNVCYARVTAQYAPGKMPGEPQIQFVVRGALLYDLRQDPGVGGSGSQDWNTPSSYVWTDNLAVQAYNVARGIYVGGNLLFGAGASVDEVPFASWTAAMNICDEDVALKAGGTEKRYTGGGQVAVNSDAMSFLKTLATSCAGFVGTGGGSIDFYPGVASSSVLSFTDDAIMAQEDYKLSPKLGFDALKNSVTGTFVDPNQNWSQASLPTRTNAGDIAEDGGLQLADDYQFDMISSYTQAQRVMEIVRQRNRRQLSHTITLSPTALGIERGDWVDWTSAQWGYASQNFLVTSAALQPNLDTVVTLQEVDSDIFDWDAATDELPVSGGTLSSADPADPLLATGYEVTAIAVTGGDGSTSVGISIVWTDPQDPRVTGVVVEYQSEATGVSEFGYGNDASAAQMQITSLLSAGVYMVRFGFTTISGVIVDWTDWQTVTLDAVTYSPSLVAAAVAAAVSEAEAAVAAELGELQDQITAVDAQITSIDGTLATVDATVAAAQAEAGNATTALRQAIEDETDVAVLLQKLGLNMNTLQKKFAGTVAFAQQELSSQFTDGLSAQAASHLDLVAIVDGLTAGQDDLALGAEVVELESAVADLQTGKADATALQVLDSQINDGPDSLTAQVSTLATTVAALDPESAGASIVTTLAAVRGLQNDSDDLADTLANFLNTYSTSSQRQAASLAFIIDEISATVTQGLSAEAQARRDLEAALETKTGLLATASSVTTLGAEVTSLGGTLTTQGGAITSLQNTVSGLATTSALSALNSTVTAQGATITSQGSAITSLQSTVRDLATTSALNALTTTVTSQGGSLNSLASSITALQATVRGLATSSALSALSSTVSSQGSAISSQASSITSLQTTVSGLATQSALSALSSTVTSHGNTITSQGNAITSLQSGLTTADGNISSNASAISSLSSSVSTQGGKITSLSSDVTSVTSAVGAVNASGFFSVSTSSAPGDSSARIKLQVSATSGGNGASAAMFMDALSGGGTRIVFVADQFYVTDGTNNANPLSFSDGTLLIDNAIIQNLTAVNLQSGSIHNYVEGIGAPWVIPTGTSFTSVGQAILNVTCAKPIVVLLAGRAKSPDALIVETSIVYNTSSGNTTDGVPNQTFSFNNASNFVTIGAILTVIPVSNGSGNAFATVGDQITIEIQSKWDNNAHADAGFLTLYIYQFDN